MRVENSIYESFIHKSRYARWREEDKRRETWEETVSRYITFFYQRCYDNEEIDLTIFDELSDAIENPEVVPSMRNLMTAGKALDRDNAAGYNCAYAPIDHPRAFDEMMYILMCGTGVGFSVERQYVSKLPEVAEDFYETDTVITVRDSKIGWAASFRGLISLLYSGQVPRWDTSKVRQSGEILKTFGGRASGPEPLENLFRFTITLFRGAAGRRLNSLECHDLCCKIAETIVVGGVRRSALISLSNLSDDRMRRCKMGEWQNEHSFRSYANNSVCYNEKPDFDAFLSEWVALYKSRAGERGIISRPALKKQVARNGRRDENYEFGTNPCSEIILRPNQFCNLSEVIIRPNDTLKELKRKVRLATILGTLQATLTDFRYLRKCWKTTTEEERLLGVSLTGIMDHTVLGNSYGGDLDGKFQSTPLWLDRLKEVAIETNAEWADKLGIPRAAAITCVKPSGTVSQLVNSSSGIHPRFAQYYIRRVRNDIKDPISQFLIDQGIPYEVDNTNPNVYVFSFPMEGCSKLQPTADTVTASQQLDLWEVYQKYWCEHKPSCTVYYRDDEFLEIGQWIYNHFDEISGVSFMPYTDHIYTQAPYEEITKERYEELIKDMPENVDWDLLSKYESTDNTTSSQEFACTSGQCEI